MPHTPLCALVFNTDGVDAHHVAASARACLSDIRLVLTRMGFERAANGILLASLAIEDDLQAKAEAGDRQAAE